MSRYCTLSCVMEMMLHGMISRCPVAMKILSLARRSGEEVPVK